MGEQYRKTLEKLSVSQRRKFLEEDWNAHFMLLEMYAKDVSDKPDFDTFCNKFVESFGKRASPQSRPLDEPYSWSKYIQKQLGLGIHQEFESGDSDNHSTDRELRDEHFLPLENNTSKSGSKSLAYEPCHSKTTCCQQTDNNSSNLHTILTTKK